jgi:protein required for attachment to host cells
MGETDFHQQEEDRWVKDAAEELKKRALRNDFDALAVIAPPKALGVLRKELHKEVEKRIVLTINKEMTDRPIPDIEELLVGEGAPPA